MHYVVYDCEIEKGIPPRDPLDRIPGIEYVETDGDPWREFGQMGLTVITAWDSLELAPRIFLEDNLEDFQHLIDGAERVIGFNNWRFDDNLVAVHGIDVPAHKSSDLLATLWAAAGLGTEYDHSTHAHFGLEKIAVAFGLGGKSGHGALAPVQWQRGEHGKVIDYCMRDTVLTAKLVEHAARYGNLPDPRGAHAVDGRVHPLAPLSVGLHLWKTKEQVL